MKCSRVPAEAWRIIEIKIRRYPESKAEYENAIDLILKNKKENDGQPKGNNVGKPVEEAAIKMADDPWLQRIKREIDAIEAAYNALIPEHQKIIRVRFWSYRHYNMKYFDMERCTSYSDRQMKKVVGKFIRAVGKNLGEL